MGTLLAVAEGSPDDDLDHALRRAHDGRLRVAVKDAIDVAGGMRLLAPEWTVAPRRTLSSGRLRMDGVEPAVEAAGQATSCAHRRIHISDLMGATR